MKKRLYGILAVVVVVVCLVSFLTSGLEHIEDTNGDGDRSLTMITDQDIIERKMGSMGLRKSTNNLNNTICFSSNKFTGVYEIMWTNVIFSSGLRIDWMNYEVNAGNFKMVVLVDGQIAAVAEPGVDCVELGEVKGDVSLVIAGESANFSFEMFQSEYNSYGHPS